MRKEHVMSLASRARGAQHRRHDSNDDGQTRNGYRRTEGTSRFQQCIDIQGKFTRRDLCLDRTHSAFLPLPLSPSLGERSTQALHAQDDRDLRFTTDQAHRSVSP